MEKTKCVLLGGNRMISRPRITLEEQAISSMSYFMLKHNKLEDSYVHEELLSFYVTLESAIRCKERSSLDIFEDVLINELVEGSYFEEPDFEDELHKMLERCASPDVTNYIMYVVNRAKQLWREAEQIETPIKDEYFSVIRWHYDDLEMVFSKYGIPWTEENIQKFMDNRGPRTLEERSVEEGWTILDDLVWLLQNNGTLPTPEEENNG